MISFSTTLNSVLIQTLFAYDNKINHITMIYYKKKLKHFIVMLNETRPKKKKKSNEKKLTEQQCLQTNFMKELTNLYVHAKPLNYLFYFCQNIFMLTALTNLYFNSVPYHFCLYCITIF